MPSVPKRNRRRIATLIRVRQEVHKRLDAVAPIDPDKASSAKLFTGSFAAGLGQDSLRSVLSSASAGRYPLTHLERRDTASLPARAELLASAERYARGEWELFGSRLRVDLDTLDWTRHPTTGVKASNVHWTRVPYMTGIGGGDVKQIWELSRHAELVRLAQAYYLTRDDAYARTAITLVDRWIDQNPPGRGVNWTSSLEVAFRSIAWCWIWVLTSTSPAWDDVRLRRFLWSLWHHARHVARFDSVHHSPNTHLTGEAIGLLYVGLFFPELNRSREWVELARDILDEELDAQVFADGMHFERATGYHRYTLEFYAHYLALSNAFSLRTRSDLRDRVRQQAVAALLFQRPDGSWPVIGDEDSGNTVRLSTASTQDQQPILAVAAVLTGATNLLPNGNGSHAAAWWLLRDDQWQRLLQMRATRPSARASGVLPDAGYYVGRDAGGTGWYCAVDAGPHGGNQTGHAHTDLGHVEIAHGETRLVSDPGCAVYTTDRAARDLARSERVHACLVLDGEPLAVPGGPFSWTQLSPAPTVHSGDGVDAWWCDLSYERTHRRGSLRHQRQIALVHGIGVAVCDWISGNAPDGLALHWPLDADPNELRVDGISLDVKGHRISWRSSALLSPSFDHLSRAPGYGRTIEGRVLRVAVCGSLPLSVVTVFAEASVVPTVRFGAERRLELSLATARGPVDLGMAPGTAPGRLGTPNAASREGALR
jgi:hypothetical protein